MYMWLLLQRKEEMRRGGMDFAQHYEALEVIYHTYANSAYGAFITMLFILQPIAVTVITVLFQRESKKRRADNDKAEKRVAIRAEESLLAMRLMSAITKLSMVIALAYKDGSPNGKLDAALTEAEQAQKEYYTFINKIATKKISSD